MLNRDTVRRLAMFANTFEVAQPSRSDGMSRVLVTTERFHEWFPNALESCGIKVKPCPFCGSTYGLDFNRYGVRIGMLSSQTGGVQCTECGAKIERYNLPTELADIEDDEGRADYYEWWIGLVLGALDVWNSRLAPQTGA